MVFNYAFSKCEKKSRKQETLLEAIYTNCNDITPKVYSFSCYFPCWWTTV